MEVRIYEQSNATGGIDFYFEPIPPLGAVQIDGGRTIPDSEVTVHLIAVPDGSGWTGNGADMHLRTPEGKSYSARQVWICADKGLAGFASID